MSQNNGDESRVGLLSGVTTGDNIMLNNSIPFVDDDGGGAGVSAVDNLNSVNDKIKSKNIYTPSANNYTNKYNHDNDEDDHEVKDDRRKSLVERKNLQLKIQIEPRRMEDDSR